MGSTTTNKSHQKIKDFISWFEIPVYNIHRAAAFYNAIYSIEMEINTSTDYAMAYFPADKGCLLYTSDAADERSSVDLGGRRIIKKKTSEDHE